VRILKAHAYGNDFLLLESSELPPVIDRPALARVLCERHRGIGADGLLIYERTGLGASMRLLNADGSRSEVSGNGVRCLAAWLARESKPRAGAIEIETEAGVKRLELLSEASGKYTFRAAMGQPEHIAIETIQVEGRPVEAVTLRVGNPQCVVLGDVTAERLHSMASALAVHPRFPEGTNVELASVESPGLVRILIWERGVGPTEASGTGACAAAVAAMTHGGAARDVQVVSPGGAQRVEWREDGLFLTGWAEVVADVSWIGPLAAGPEAHRGEAR
jgi:diaminopimelate epimerase